MTCHCTIELREGCPDDLMTDVVPPGGLQRTLYFYFLDDLQLGLGHWQLGKSAQVNISYSPKIDTD